MKPRNIGGVLSYELLARQHQPSDPEVLAKEVRRLASTGLKPVDISVALRLSLPQVLEMLREVTP